jgi:hypothetical protein
MHFNIVSGQEITIDVRKYILQDPATSAHDRRRHAKTRTASNVITTDANADGNCDTWINPQDNHRTPPA